MAILGPGGRLNGRLYDPQIQNETPQSLYQQSLQNPTTQHVMKGMQQAGTAIESMIPFTPGVSFPLEVLGAKFGKVRNKPKKLKMRGKHDLGDGKYYYFDTPEGDSLRIEADYDTQSRKIAADIYTRKAGENTFMASNDMRASIGDSGVREILDELAKDFPKAEEIWGTRITGTRTGKSKNKGFIAPDRKKNIRSDFTFLDNTEFPDIGDLDIGDKLLEIGDQLKSQAGRDKFYESLYTAYGKKLSPEKAVQAKESIKAAKTKISQEMFELEGTREARSLRSESARNQIKQRLNERLDIIYDIEGEIHDIARNYKPLDNLTAEDIRLPELDDTLPINERLDALLETFRRQQGG